MANFRTAFHTAIAKQFVDNIYYGKDNFYYFIGRVQPWETVTQTASDGSELIVTSDNIAPDDYSVCYHNDILIRDDIVYMHKISANDVSVACPAHFWKAGTRYEQWDDRKVMVEAPFYVVNSEYNVYKCLNNNSYWSYEVNPLTGKYEEVLYASKSVYEPRGQFNSVNQEDGVIKTDDGYVWKYMYNIPYIKRKKFINSKWIPVQKALQESFYSNGAIEQVVVVNKGSGYSTGSTTHAVVEATIFTTLPNIRLNISYLTGSIDSVTILDPGEGLDGVVNIRVYDGGSGGHGKYNDNQSAVLRPIIQDGKLVNVSIDDPGIGYASDEKTKLVWSGDGVGASLHPIVDADGTISGVVVSNGGQGYTYLDVKAVSSDGQGTGAEFKAIVGGSITSTDQSDVEQSAIPGAIYAIALENMGAGYVENDDSNPNNTTVTIDGDGEGASAHAVIVDGKITQIVMDSFGRDYTYADVIISRGWTMPGYDNAVARAILPPIAGHGYDAINELYGRAVSIYTSIRDDSNLIGLSQDFRQFGLIANPRTFTDQRISASEVSIMLKLTLRKTIGLEIDSEVLIDDVKHRIVAMEGNTVSLIQESAKYRDITEYSEFKYYDPVKQITTIYEIESVVDVPSVNKYSGELLATANKVPFVIEKARTIGIRTQIIF